MDYRTLATVLVKCAGLVLVVFTLAWFPFHIDFLLGLKSEDGLSALLLGVLPIVVPLLIGLLLVSFPATISRTVTGSGPPPSERDVRDLWTLVAVGIGLYVTVRALLDLTHFLALSLLTERSILQEDPYQTASFFVDWVELAIGLGLLLGGRGIAALLYRLRFGER